MKTVVLNMLIICVAFVFPSVTCLAADPPMYTVSMYTGPVPGLPDEFKGLQWHRCVSKDFEVLSIDKAQGTQLIEYLDKLKTWTERRWGLADIPYNKQCMVICVPHQTEFEKWFRQHDIEPVEAQTKNVDGTPRQVYAIWIAGEPGFLTNKLPEKVGLVNLMNYETTFPVVKVPHWMHVGMSVLNNDVRSIRRLIETLDPDRIYDARFLFDPGNSKSLRPEEYKAYAAAACLLLRKQHNGAAQFTKFMEVHSKGNAEQSLKIVYGWQDYTDFNRSFNNYTRALSYDIRINRTPDMGLTWFLPEPSK